MDLRTDYTPVPCRELRDRARGCDLVDTIQCRYSLIRVRKQAPSCGYTNTGGGHEGSGEGTWVEG